MAQLMPKRNLRWSWVFPNTQKPMQLTVKNANKKNRRKAVLQRTKEAQSVEMPSRANFGCCHFYGGGGDNVKHGDLSSVLFDPPKDVDVHMSADGEGFKLIEYTLGDGYHRATYKSIKGNFTYAENLQPEYSLFNGVMNYTTIATQFDP